MGDVACNVVYALTSGLIVYFYTNVIGVSAGVVGTILLISRVFDGVSDLLIAQLMDKINSRHGKARAWILWMAAPYAISATALFAVPSHAGKMVQAIYIFVTYNLCTTVVYTALNLPYSAMAPLMTNDGDDLAKLNIFRMSMSPVSNMIVTALSLPLINLLGGDQKAWITVTAVYGVIAFGMLMWTFLGTKERFHTKAAAEAENLPFLVRLKAALQNKYFIIMFLMVMALALYQNVNGTVSTYYAQYVLGNAEIMGVMQTCEKIPWILGIICMAPLIKKFGKRNLVLGGAIICIAAQVILMINPENIKLVLVASILRGLGEAPINGLTFTMLADVINYGHWKTGIRVHALIFSTFTVGQKFGGGVAGWAIGQLMQLSGFTGSVTETVEAVAVSVFTQCMWHKTDLTTISGDLSFDITMSSCITYIRRLQRSGICHPVLHQHLRLVDMSKCSIIIPKRHDLITLDRNMFLIPTVCKQNLILLPSFRNCMII